MRRHVRWLGPLAGAGVLAVLGWRLGAGPFVVALSRVDPWSLAAATCLTAVSTVCSAWRWTLVARRLGVGLRLRTAVAACYRSQFLNVTLPGGVLGDVHRGIRHGREAGDVRRALRAVVWERFAGQAVLVMLSSVVLAWTAVPLPAGVGGAAGALLVLALLAVPLAVGALVVTKALRARGVRGPREVSGARGVRRFRAIGRAWVVGLVGVVAASCVALAGHVAVFVIAARAAGAPAPPGRLLPLALLVLLAMGLPLNLAGWGPREGVAAWAFAAAGLGVNHGVVTAVTYGVMVLVANLPGAALVLASRMTRAG